MLLAWALPNEQQRRVAALLYAGPRSWLAGPTAAQLHGFVATDLGRRVFVLVPAPQNPREVAWVSIRRTYITEERIVEREPVRYSCRPRALVDAAAEMTGDHARAMVVDAVRRRLVRLEDVAHWVEARRPNDRRALRAIVAEAAAGVWSVPEADLVRLVSTSNALPVAWANPTLTDLAGRRLTTPDLWLDDVGMAVMVHSREFHAGELDWEATVGADDDLSAARVVVIGVTPEALNRDPAAVLRKIEGAYERARSSGVRASVIATPRQTWSATSPVISPMVG